MASPNPGSGTSSLLIPQKRSADEDEQQSQLLQLQLHHSQSSALQPAPIPQPQQHTPAVPSPLNPDPAPSKPRSKPGSAREQRERKETVKKREAKEGSGSHARSGTPDTGGQEKIGIKREDSKRAGGGGGKKKDANAAAGAKATRSTLSLIRYAIPRPKMGDFEPKETPPLVPAKTLGQNGRMLYDAGEHVHNRKGFRYMPCIADPRFPFIQYHRQTEMEPFAARFAFEDASSHVLVDEEVRAVSTEKGFRMARANVCAREGRWYWECKILSGIKPIAEGGAGISGSGPHVRLGFSRREASLETPVGFDAYSYGLRDAAGQKMHMSRPKDFMPAGEEIFEGDVIGLEINLPSLSLHKKVIEGSYNKAVDVSDAVDPVRAATPQDVIRDRVPIKYKNHMYFEQFDYQPTKDLEDLMNPSLTGGAAAADKSALSQAPHPNHPSVQMRTLPKSCIKVYKNGKYVGTPFTDLFAFLPPASKPQSQTGLVVAREGLDDGQLGYFPSVSVFRGGAAEVNFGPDFWFPPPELVEKADVEMSNCDGTAMQSSRRNLRAMADRYSEQIAEDIVYDIVDEVDLWSTDDGKLDTTAGAKAPTVLGPVDPAAPGLDAAVRNAASANGNARAGEIKEVVQDDE